MPTPKPTPIPEPYPNLQFPKAEAEQVVAAARQALHAVQNAASDRRSKVQSLKSDAQWTGNAARQFFGTDAPGMASQASSIVGQLQAVIQTVQTGITNFENAQSANASVDRANQRAMQAWENANPQVRFR